jgi:hypothetical protein
MDAEGRYDEDLQQVYLSSLLDAGQEQEHTSESEVQRDKEDPEGAEGAATDRSAAVGIDSTMVQTQEQETESERQRENETEQVGGGVQAAMVERRGGEEGSGREGEGCTVESVSR